MSSTREKRKATTSTPSNKKHKTAEEPEVACVESTRVEPPAADMKLSGKTYISAEQLLKDSYQLALQILKSGFRPNYIVGIWRGGTPVGIAVQEFLHYFEINTDHIAIRTSSYKGIGQREKTVRVHGLGYIIDQCNADDSLLLVDDVFDSGLSVEAVVDSIRSRSRRNAPKDIRIATVYYKPLNNRTRNTVPDFFVHQDNDSWLVFPHEIRGLSEEEIKCGKPELTEYLDQGRDFVREFPIAASSKIAPSRSRHSSSRRSPAPDR